ncbi:MAG: hypothetical protein GEU71_00875 [Actinobacteria bacterium]|nr:hypothetical protein [Actinomycetota bacterium]
MRRLGLTENVRNYRVVVNGREIGTRPDAFGNGQMYEMKNVRYLYLSRQMQAEMTLAAQRGEGYIVKVGPQTRVAATVQEAVRNTPYGGEIIRAHPDGSYTTLDGRVVEEAEGGGYRYKDPDDRDGDGDSSGGGGLNHPDGQEADRISVEEYRDMPNQSNMTPVMPWPSFPIPMPAPAPMPAPVPLFPRLLPIP